MRNALQEQMLKAGLAKKGKLARVTREQDKQRRGNQTVDDAAKADAQRRQDERAARDRALAAERKAKEEARAVQAQVRQIIDANRVPPAGDSPYRFDDGQAVRTVYVDAQQRRQLAGGTLVIVRDGEDFALLPRTAADKVRERDAARIALDHAGDAGTSADEADPYYAQFQVPDDLIW